MNLPISSSAARPSLAALLLLGALNAFAGGYYGLVGAPGVPAEWLRGSPFSDYTTPSLILFVVVGGSLFVAAVAVLVRWRMARVAAVVACSILLGWIIVQLAIIGPVSWLQPVTALAGFAGLFLASRLPAPAPADESHVYP